MARKIKSEWRLGAFSFISLGPALIFWSSAMLYVGLGSDYFFEVVLTRIASSWWGNLGIIICVLVLPGLTAAVNGMAYILYRRMWQKWMVIISAGFIVLGLYTAAIRA